VLLGTDTLAFAFADSFTCVHSLSPPRFFQIAKLLKKLPHLRFIIQTNRIEYEETKAVSKLNSGTKVCFLRLLCVAFPHASFPSLAFEAALSVTTLLLPSP
jgi:hypothetical protein